MGKYKNDFSEFEGENTYVHWHKKNIGRMLSEYSNNEKGIPSKDLIDRYDDLKKQAISAIKTQYKQAFLENAIKDDGYLLLKDTLNIDSDLDKFDLEIKQNLQKGLDLKKITALTAVRDKIDWEKLESVIKDFEDMSKEDLSCIDTLLDAIEGALTLISQDGAILAGLLNQKRLRGQKGKSVSMLGKGYLILLNKYKQNKPESIPEQQLRNAINELTNLSKKFSNGTKSGNKKVEGKDETITGSYLRDYVKRHFFSTVIGESLAMGVTSSALLTIIDDLEHIVPTGKNSEPFKYTRPDGNFIANKEESGRQGKADVKLKNVEVSLTEIFKKEMGTVRFDLGISNKLYAGIDLNNSDKKELVEVGSISLPKILGILTPDKDDAYLGYNLLAWESQEAPTDKEQINGAQNYTKAYESFQDALYTRSTIYLFGARGTKDLAQYILVNGHFISLWEIVQYVSKNFIHSRAKSGKDQSVIFNITKYKEFGKKLTIKNALDRLPAVNNVINDSSVEGRLNPKKI